MKSKTYKLLVGALLVLQLVAITATALAATGGGAQASAEDQRLTILAVDVARAGTIVNDFQMRLASRQSIDDIEEYEAQKAKLFADLDELEKLSQGNPERLAIYQDQRKLLANGDRVVMMLRSMVGEGRGNGGMSKMMVLLAGLSKLSSIEHKLCDNFDTLIQTSTSKPSSIPVLPITAGIACLVSFLLAGVLITKGPTD